MKMSQGKRARMSRKEASTRPFQPFETSETPLDAFRPPASVLQYASKLESQIWPVAPGQPHCYAIEQLRSDSTSPQRRAATQRVLSAAEPQRPRKTR